MLVHSSGGGALLDGPVLDAAQRQRRAAQVRPVHPDVAIVGVASEADWPASAPGLLRALALGRAEAAGLLPPLAAEGQLLEPPFERATATALAGAPAPLRRDADGVVRRLAVRAGDGRATLVARLAGSLGVGAAPGWIDYGLGRGFDYDRLETLLGWVEDGNHDALERKLRGRAVLIGVLGEAEQRAATPFGLAGWEPTARDSPVPMLHAQALRTLIAGCALQPLTGWWTGLSILVAAALTCLPRSAALALLGAAACGAALWYGGLGLLERGLWLPPAGVAAAALLGLGFRCAPARAADPGAGSAPPLG